MVHLFAISLLAYMSANLDDINSSVQSLTIYIRRAKTDNPLAGMDNSDTASTLTNATATADNIYDEPIALPVSLQAGGGSAKRSTVDSDEDSDGGESGKKKVSWYWSSYVYTYAGLNSQPQLSHHDLNAGAFFSLHFTFHPYYHRLFVTTWL